jgi:hypothetical protein
LTLRTIDDALDLTLCLSESIPTWINEWQNQVETPSLESSIFPHVLEDLFGGDEIATGLYDEMTFYSTHDTASNSELLSSPSSPEVLSPELSISNSLSDISNDDIQPAVQIHNHDVSSDSDSSGSEEEDEIVIATTTNTAAAYDGSDSEDEDQSMYQKAYAGRGNNPIPVASFMQRRQMEESILEKITTQLDAEKLPAILTIIGSDQDQQAHGGEVEIDLTRLDQDRLGRILAYVDACVLEQQGGPSVQLSKFLMAPVQHDKALASKKSRARARPVESDDSDDESQVYEAPKRRQRRKAPAARKRSRKQGAAKITGDIIASIDDFSFGGSIVDGPVSFSTLSSVAVHKSGGKSKTARKSTPTTPIDPESIAISRPKRRAAVHKRRMLEELLAPSDDEEEEEEDVPLVVHSEERMDMRVTEDKVIVHEPVSASVAGPLATTYVQPHVSDDEEDIDIMD